MEEGCSTPTTPLTLRQLQEGTPEGLSILTNLFSEHLSRANINFLESHLEYFADMKTTKTLFLV